MGRGGGADECVRRYVGGAVGEDLGCGLGRRRGGGRLGGAAEIFVEKLLASFAVEGGIGTAFGGERLGRDGVFVDGEFVIYSSCGYASCGHATCGHGRFRHGRGAAGTAGGGCPHMILGGHGVVGNFFDHLAGVDVELGIAGVFDRDVQGAEDEVGALEVDGVAHERVNDF